MNFFKYKYFFPLTFFKGVETMFTVTGQVLNVFKAPEGKKKTGETYGGENKIQLLGTIRLKTGGVKNELITLTMPFKWGLELSSRVGTTITLPVALMASGNVLRAYIPDAEEIPKDILERPKK